MFFLQRSLEMRAVDFYHAASTGSICLKSADTESA